MLLDSRPTDSSRRSFFKRVYLLSLIITVVILISYVLYLDPRPRFSGILELSTPWKSKSKSKFFGVIDKIYVISLPTRQDRRTEMEKLRKGLGVEWAYIDAFPATEPMVNSIKGKVVSTRASASQTHSQFKWPEISEELVHSKENIELWQDDSWYPSPDPPPTSLPLVQCTQKDYDMISDPRTLPEHLILTPGRVACWRSHIEVIHQIANDDAEATLIMEDDVDVERDLEGHLKRIWPSLPKDWDSVYLGHCWSNETFWPALPAVSTDPSVSFKPSILNSSLPTLHPSQGPKCNHGYVLSRTGARRILLHLRYPLFAYSRAVDQALAWMIESRRTKSFSVFPNIIAQRKVSKSDIMVLDGVENAGWKDFLVDGFFGDNKRP
ncbi:hypothetical protein CPB83DRAFT_856806 [Crepidotus variabilis]|uniref:Glycosyl transferase family 25 domain-containing protein n=1 Tax=Crepidotus variabilis TaxID=179855 RepID=A0A9P6EDL3_9AGAR|nr:hypothetical protein CPB83DRAFT_856806 [Crepidotus variabilis]